MNRSSHAYYYDLNGNRTYVLDTGLTTNYSSNSVNAYTSITGSTAPTYDLNGTGRGRATRTNRFLFVEGMASTLVYDKENRLRSITRNLGGSVNSYTYDALGRISTLTYSLNGVSTTEVYTWTGWTLLYRELIQNAVAIEKFRYTWGLDVSGTLEGAGGVGGLLAIEHNVNNNYSWDIRYPHYDANGNIMALSNSSGQISARYRYDAFGKTILSTDVDGTGWNTKNIHGFSTKPTLGNHKLHYYGYRWYDASNGRWINRDPIEESGGLNLYGFVGNDGVGMWDVLGLLVDATDINDGDACPVCCKTCKGTGDARPVIHDDGSKGHEVKAKIVSPTFESVCKTEKQCGDCCAVRYYWFTCYNKACNKTKGINFTQTVTPIRGAPAWTAVSVAVQSWKICKCESGKWSCKSSDGNKDADVIVYSLDQTTNIPAANWVLQTPGRKSP